MKRKAILRLVLGALALAAAIAVFSLARLDTLRFSLRMAAAVLPGTLTVNSVQGRLGDAFTLEGVAYRDEEIEIAVESLSLSWQPASLLHRSLHVRSLAVSGLAIRLPQDKDPNPEFLPPLVLPLPVTLEKVSISSLRLDFTGDPEPVLLDTVLLKNVQGRGDRLQVGGLEATMAASRVRLHGEVQTSGEYKASLTGDYALHPPDYFSITGRTELAGTLARLAVRVDMATPFPGTLRGTLHDLAGDARWSAEILVGQANLAEISKEWPGVVLANFRATGSGTLAAYSLQAEADVDYPPLTTTHIRTGIAGDADGLVFSDGRLGIGEEVLDVEGRLAWQGAFTWQGAVSGEQIALGNMNPSWPEVVFSRLSIAGQGVMDGYSLQVETDLAHAHLRDVRATGAVVGNGDGLRFADLRLHHRDAVLTGEGQLDWQEGLAWQAEVSGMGIDPGAWHPQWPGLLDFKAITSGALKGDAVQTTIELVALDGMLRDYPLQASGRVAMANDTLTIDHLSLRSAESVLQASGRYGDRVDLDFTLRSPDLASLWPGAAGSLQAQGSLRGSRQSPRLQFDLAAAEISLQDAMMAKVIATMEGDLAAGGILAGTVRATGVTVAGIGLDSISADLHGTAGKHQLQTDIRTGSNSLLLRAEGGLADTGWQGVIAGAELTEQHLGSWHLGEPAPLAISAQAASLKQLCLAGSAASRICVDGSLIPGGSWQAEAAIENFPLDLVPPGLLADGRLEGLLTGHGNVEGDNSTIRRGNLDLATGKTVMTFTEQDERRRTISWHNNTLQATLADDRLAAQLASLLADGSTISASLLLDDFRVAPFSLEQSRIDASAQFEIRDLQLLAALVYPAADPYGKLHGNLSLQGDAVAPTITASVALDEGEVRIPPLGIALRELKMMMSGSFPEFRLELAGGSKGKLQGEGRISLADPQHPDLTLNIRGEGVELARLPELDLLISPEVDVVLRRDRGEIRGTIRIPEARIAPRDMSGTISPSADVVIVDSRQEQVKSGWPLATDLLVIAGDNVLVDAFGLRGKVTGRLQVADLPGKPVTGDGILNVTQGTFSVYGRELTIRTGRLLYSGNPLDNPGVEVRAENTTGEITTGVQVTGFLAAPEISFYADPPMEENEIISRLLMNTALLGSAKEDRGFLGSVTSGTKLDAVTSTVRGVKESLRLDEVKIATGKTREDLSLVIGTWLSPDLYVSYGKNLLKESGSFNTRYLLGRGFSIQTETGATQSGIDLKYEIDRY